MDHTEARMLASARSDGELEPARFGELDDHLASCEACYAFAGALPGLSALAAALPREHAPAELTRRVRAGLGAPGRRVVRRARWRVAPALAAAIVVALVVALVGSVPIVRIPAADAATALTRITSLFVEREITSFGEDGTPERVTRERVWFKAPGLVRTESETDGARSLAIARPGVRYAEDASGRFLETGLLPSTSALPEPLTPTVALLGIEAGPGPVVLGRPTTRVELRFEQDRRVAFVDEETFTVLGSTESVVLAKETFQGDRVTQTKRTLALEINPRLDDALFRIPTGVEPTDGGATPRPLGTLSAPPAGRLEGLALVAAAAGRDGEAMLFAKGAFEVLIEVDGSGYVPPPSRTRPVAVGAREAHVVLPLYGLPEVRFTVAGHLVAIRAPLPVQELVLLAERLYP